MTLRLDLRSHPQINRKTSQGGRRRRETTNAQVLANVRFAPRAIYHDEQGQLVSPTKWDGADASWFGLDLNIQNEL